MLVLLFMVGTKCVWLFQRLGGFEGELCQHPLRPQLRAAQNTAGVQVHMWLIVSFCHVFILKLQTDSNYSGLCFLERTRSLSECHLSSNF